MLIRTIEPTDAAQWEGMRQALWPSEDGEHAAEIAAFLQGNRANPAEVLMAFDAAGTAVGFAEVSIRSYAEGCYSGRVAYLEGWYVDPARRSEGIGGAWFEPPSSGAGTRAAQKWAPTPASRTGSARRPISPWALRKSTASSASESLCESKAAPSTPGIALLSFLRRFSLPCGMQRSTHVR